MVTELNHDLCTGCGVCAAVCPKKCLSIQLDGDGFYKADCDSSRCIDCGLCDKVCPKFLSVDSAKGRQALSVVSKDENTLSTTSSGGACYELAKKALEQGKKVCACVYDYSSHIAKHVVITDASELEATKGSKYFQSYTKDGFSKIFDGQEWVVFGSPCQISAIDAAARIKNKRDKLVLIDFFCHGTPSMNLWKKYVAENGGKDIKKIDFRSKEYGWHSFSLRFEYANGNAKSDYQDNMFYNFFFGNMCLSEACYSCQFKAFKSAADIRVGDFWGDKYRDDRKGVSCCVAFTEAGIAAIKAISDACVIREEATEDVLEEQMVKSPDVPGPRRRVLRALRGRRRLATIYNTTLFTYRAKCKLKSILRRQL